MKALEIFIFYFIVVAYMQFDMVSTNTYSFTKFQLQLFKCEEKYSIFKQTDI